MRLETSRFGNVDVDDQTVITLTHPIIGFQEFRRFVLLPGPANSGLTWLQSTESGELAFLLMNPRAAMPDYAVKLGNHELVELGVESADALDVYTLVVVPSDPSKVRTNLKAPVLINPRQRIGKQTILENSDYPVQFILAQAQHGGQGSREEMQNARTNP